MHSFKNVLSKMSKVSGSNIFLPFKPLPISMMLKGNASAMKTKTVDKMFLKLFVSKEKCEGYGIGSKYAFD